MKCEPWQPAEISPVTTETTKYDYLSIPIDIKLDRTKDQFLAVICSENPVEECSLRSRFLELSMIRDQEQILPDCIMSFWRSISPTRQTGIIHHLNIYSEGAKSVGVYRLKGWNLEPNYEIYQERPDRFVLTAQ